MACLGGCTFLKWRLAYFQRPDWAAFSKMVPGGLPSGGVEQDGVWNTSGLLESVDWSSVAAQTITTDMSVQGEGLKLLQPLSAADGWGAVRRQEVRRCRVPGELLSLTHLCPREAIH